MNMKLIGAPTIKDVVPGMVDTRSLNPGNAPDTMFEANCKYCIWQLCNITSEADSYRRAYGPSWCQGQIVIAYSCTLPALPCHVIIVLFRTANGQHQDSACCTFKSPVGAAAICCYVPCRRGSGQITSHQSVFMLHVHSFLST